MRTKFVFGALLSAAALVGTPGVAQAPQSISANDKAIGAKAHPQLMAQFGGAYSGPQADYVRRVGQRISVQSGLSNAQSDFTVTLLNSPANNAFAIPGGYVYVTRQLLALMNDEAELASVLGHETGHVAARHSQKRQNAATRNSVLGALGQVLAGAVLGGDSAIGQVLGRGIGSGFQLLTLQFSRSQEYEADDLGVTYLARAGYDPRASSTMLASLAAQSALDARTRNQDGRSAPAWASTHPDPASRVTRAAQKATATRKTGGTRNRDGFLDAIDGVLYEDDPKQGVIDGQTFRHPELRLQFTVPDGFAMANGTQAVSITGSAGQATFTGVTFDGDLERYIASAFNALTGGKGGINYGTPQRRTINGLSAAIAQGRANTQSGALDVTVIAYAFNANTAYHFVLLTRAGSAIGPFDGMAQSMRRMTAAEATAVKPRRIDVVTVRSGDTVASLAGRMAYTTLQTERFLTLNALSAGTALRPGQRVKLVVYG
ncbi:MAG: M48 family metalloprotease [Sphingomonadaceae bacterium]